MSESKKVLIIDDDRDFVSAIESLLQIRGLSSPERVQRP